MARQTYMTDAEVEQEIQRLRGSDYVKLSQLEQRLKADKRRKYLADLRWHEKRGQMLAAQGINIDNMEERLFPETEEPTDD